MEPFFTAPGNHMKKHRGIAILIYAAIFSNARFFLEDTSGVVSYMLAALILLAPTLILNETAELIAPALGLKVTGKTLTNLALAVGSLMFSVVLIETGLQIATRFHPRGGQARSLQTLTMPAEWQRRSAPIEGAQSAYYWHNVLHVHNRDNMRLLGEFPPRRPDTFRLITLGDSIT
ncbi:MAG: hypothetical protein ACREJI_03695, partial [Candidatus Methylomirabilales bacterium]